MPLLLALMGMVLAVGIAHADSPFYQPNLPDPFGESSKKAFIAPDMSRRSLHGTLIALNPLSKEALVHVFEPGEPLVRFTYEDLSHNVEAYYPNRPVMAEVHVGGTLRTPLLIAL